MRWLNNAAPATKFERANLADIEVLSWLAEQAGGWWHRDEVSKGPKFVPLGDWLEIYRNQPKTELT